jgi:hypothetical protein
MSCSRYEETERYWRSTEALEPMLTYLGLRKRLDLARVNQDFQAIVHSWLRRRQRNLILINESRAKNAMKFRSSCTLKIPADGVDLLITQMELFPNLSTLTVEDIQSLQTLQMIGQVNIGSKEHEKIKPSGFKEIDECLKLMQLIPRLEEIEVNKRASWTDAWLIIK